MNDNLSVMDVVLWGVVPYVVLSTFLVGHYWRYRYDKFGWTTRSSELYEKRLLRLASPLFHFGILVVLVGHVIGLGVPEQWTNAIGLPNSVYHVGAVTLGAIAGLCTLVGAALLIYRRRTVGPVFSATTQMDKVMYLFLITVIGLGVWNTLVANVTSEYNYREGLSVWYRDIWFLRPHPELMASAPATFQAHALVAMGLFALWPFTRLVHVWSAPVGYLWRPYIVYRSRGVPLGTKTERPGWERVT